VLPTTAALAAILGISACQERQVISNVPSWIAEEESRVGSLDGPITFAGVRGLALAKSGALFVWDQNDIRILTTSGEIRNLARRGQGPGEIASPNGLLISPNDTVYVVDPEAGRLLLFDGKGRYGRSMRVIFDTYGWAWSGAVDTRGYILDPILDPHRFPDRARRIAPDGSVVDTMPHVPCLPRDRPRQRYIVIGNADRYMSFGIPNQPQPQVVFDNDGTLWCAPTDEYLLLRGALGSVDTLALVKRHVQPIPISGLERDRLLRTCRSGTAPDGTRCDEGSVPRVKPVIEAIALDYSSRLWVRRTDTPSNAPGFDLFARDGSPIATVCARVPLAGVPIARGDTLVGVTHDSIGVEYIVRLRLVRRAAALVGPATTAHCLTVR
jgi:hypothetical protein